MMTTDLIQMFTEITAAQNSPVDTSDNKHAAT